MSDKWIGYSHICLTDPRFGFTEYKDGKWSLIDNGEPLKKHLSAIANAGANGLRLIPYSVWQEHEGKRSQFCPWVFDESTQKWDLSQFNDYYWPIMRKVVEIANACRLSVWFAWIDHCQFQKGWWNAYSPWIWNIQKIASAYDDKAGVFVQAFMRRSIDEFKGQAVYWHLGNEVMDARMPDFAYKYMFPVIKAKAISLDRIGAGGGRKLHDYFGNGKYADKPNTIQDITRKRFGAFFGEDKKKLMVREVHGVGDYVDDYRKFGDDIAEAVWLWAKDHQPEHVVLGDWFADTDGQKKGDSKCDKDTDGARPSADTMYRMAVYLWKTAGIDNAHIFHCPQTTDVDCLVE
ncbi:MAG: hypothetical protein WC455_27245, partial [Dehalococcoidia bacterium]